MFTILKVQLVKKTIRRKAYLLREKPFIECAQEIVYFNARDEETHIEVEETGWSRVTYRRPRTIPIAWKRDELV